MRAIMAVMLLVLAGCAGTEETLRAPDPTPAAERPVAEDQAAPAAPAPRWPTEDLEGFYWSLNGTETPLAFSFTFDVGEQQNCWVAIRRSGDSTAPADGPSRAYLLEMQGGRSWSVTASGQAAYVHHDGLVDTREAEGGQGSSASTMQRRGPTEGQVQVTLLLQQASSWAWTDEVLQGAALGVECEKPFDLVEARRGTELVLFSPLNLQGGTGAGSLVGASATLGSGIGFNVSSEQAGMFMAALTLGASVMEARTTTPAGDETLLWPSAYLASHWWDAAEGAGSYGVEIDRVAAGIEQLWGGIYAFEGSYETDDGRQETSPIKRTI